MIDHSTLDGNDLTKALGEGPLRFLAAGERSTAEQLASLTDEERACVDGLREKWEKSHPDEPFDDAMYLRFARCSPGKNKFRKDASYKVMKKFDRRYLTLTAGGMEDQLRSKTLFPVPGLKSKEGHGMFYMRPARYFPKKTSTQEIIDNLAYCMNTMCESEKESTEGIGFLANLDDWSMVNFSVSYCYQFMMMLQGRVPVRVRLFLIVNPPSWFGKIWNIMKPMLAADFRKKVHMIPDSRLEEFLADDYQTYLPDDVSKGMVDTDVMVEDFIAFRKNVESEKNAEPN